MRRPPPTRVEENVNALCDLCPDYADDLLGNVDQPLKILRDEEKGREFLGCDYNRDGDSFRCVLSRKETRVEMLIRGRSPWSNVYMPEPVPGPTPSPKLRQLETSLNLAFDTYRELYFEGGVSSVYLWDLEDEPSGKEMSFAGVVLVKKSVFDSSEHAVFFSSCQARAEPGVALASPSSSSPSENSGTWDSLHVFECHERGRSAKYKLTSTVMLVLGTPTTAKAEKMEGKSQGEVTLSGSMTRQAEVDYPLTTTAGHIPNIGRMVEDME
jgi:capping protein beta